MVGTPESSDEEQRLRHALAFPARADLAAVAHLRRQVADLDAEDDRVPSAILLGSVGRRHGEIALLRSWAVDPRVRHELLITAAESAVLMGQLSGDVALRRNPSGALSYFDAAIRDAEAYGDRTVACRAELRRSYGALYGQRNPVTGLEMADRAAVTGRGTSNVLAGLALMHVAEAHAMRGHAGACEKALSAADAYCGKVEDADHAAPLFTPTELGRMAGSCYLRLGDAARAAAFLTVTVDSVGRTKAGAVAAANLALAHTRQQRVDEAVGSLRRAIDIVDATRGGGGTTVAFAAGRALHRWRDTPAVQHVQDRLLALMTG